MKAFKNGNTWILFLENEESGKDFILNKDLNQFDIPEGWTEETLKELTHGVIVSKEGASRFRKTQWWSYMLAPDEKKKYELPFGGKETKGYGSYRFPKIPYWVYEQVESFFREVYEKHKSEAFVALWMNSEDPTDWKVSVPKQEVSAAAAEYEDLAKDHPGLPYEYMGDIHSHASMGASHSGVDDADEIGRLPGWHVTLGDFDRPSCSFSARCCFGPYVAEKVDFENVFDCPPEKIASHPKDWMERVSKKTYSSQGSIGFGTGGAYGGSHDGDDWWNGPNWKKKNGNENHQKRKKDLEEYEIIGFRTDEDESNAEYLMAMIGDL